MGCAYIPPSIKVFLLATILYAIVTFNKMEPSDLTMEAIHTCGLAIAIIGFVSCALVLPETILDPSWALILAHLILSEGCVVTILILILNFTPEDRRRFWKPAIDQVTESSQSHARHAIRLYLDIFLLIMLPCALDNVNDLKKKSLFTLLKSRYHLVFLFFLALYPFLIFFCFDFGCYLEGSILAFYPVCLIIRIAWKKYKKAILKVIMPRVWKRIKAVNPIGGRQDTESHDNTDNASNPVNPVLSTHTGQKLPDEEQGLAPIFPATPAVAQSGNEIHSVSHSPTEPKED